MKVRALGFVCKLLKFRPEMFDTYETLWQKWFRTCTGEVRPNKEGGRSGCSWVDGAERK